MIIGDIIFNADADDVVNELSRQLHINHIPLLQSIKDTPDNIMVSCPYHKNGQERRPSAGIKKLDGVFHCFTCGETHSLFEVISYCFGKYDDILGKFGREWLLKNFVSISVEERRPIELDFSRNRSNTVAKTGVSEAELDSYRVYHPYMWKRKMIPEVVDLFDVGYDQATDCITFPVRDVSGRTLFVARRSVKTKFFNYPAGAEKPVYGLYELSSFYKESYPKAVIICESMIDALTCWAYGKPAVALNGLGNDLQFQQLSAMPCRKFILATDNDDAGQKARNRLRSNIKNHIITEYIFPDTVKDINDMSLEQFISLKEVF